MINRFVIFNLSLSLSLSFAEKRVWLKAKTVVDWTAVVAMREQHYQWPTVRFVDLFAIMFVIGTAS